MVVRHMGTGLALLLLVVTVPLLLTAACGRMFLYYPTALSAADRTALAGRGWSTAEVPGEAGPLQGLVRPAPAGAPWLLFFGGNAMDLGSSQWVLERIAGDRPWGLAVFAYRGYDGSAGSPTEPGLCADSLNLASWLEEQHQVAPRQLLLVGQSLGSGVAVCLAAALTEARREPAGLILASPYTSVARLFDERVPLIPVGWLTPDPFRSDTRLPALRSPVLILHGREDTLIRIEHGRAVATLLGSRAELVELDRAGHNDVWQHPRAPQAAQQFVDRLRGAASAD